MFNAVEKNDTILPNKNFFPGTDSDLKNSNIWEGIGENTKFSMRRTSMPFQVLRAAPSEELSKNAGLLIRSGYIRKQQSGIYSLLPLGYRVLQKIETHVRNAMQELNSQEFMLPILQPKSFLEQTGRWEVDVLFKLRSKGDKDFSLAFTHEEACAQLLGKVLSSYKHLPCSFFQIQTKFRDEPRAKAGLLRGREFRMKDMYSFHESQADLNSYYDLVHKKYMELFNTFGIGDRTYLTFASGGDYSKFSHEYQTICDAGEDTIYLSCDSGVAINKEIFDQLGRKCPISGSDKFIEKRAIEVGNIFKLGTRFTDAYGYTTLDENGNSKPIYMASYGIGLTRLIGTVAETLSDESGLKWPSSIAPFSVNLISLAKNETDVIATEHIFHLLDKIGIEVLYDDRQKVSAGEKFVESDLLGLPYRIVASSKLLAKNELELQRRGEEKKMVAPIEQIINFLSVNK